MVLGGPVNIMRKFVLIIYDLSNLIGLIYWPQNIILELFFFIVVIGN